MIPPEILSMSIASELQQRRHDIMPPRMREALLPCPAAEMERDYEQERFEAAELERDRAEAWADDCRKERQEEADHCNNEYRKGRF